MVAESSLLGQMQEKLEEKQEKGKSTKAGLHFCEIRDDPPGNRMELERHPQHLNLFDGGKTVAVLPDQLFTLEEVAVRFTEEEWVLLDHDQRLCTERSWRRSLEF